MAFLPAALSFRFGFGTPGATGDDRSDSFLDSAHRFRWASPMRFRRRDQDPVGPQAGDVPVQHSGIRCPENPHPFDHSGLRQQQGRIADMLKIVIGKPSEDLRLAVHEAGHAVFAYHFSMPIQEVWIDASAENGVGGQVLLGPFNCSSPSARFTCSALLYAGRMAEVLFLGIGSDTSSEDFRDMAAIYDLDIDSVSSDDASVVDLLKVASAVRPLVKQVLTFRQLAVCRLARALMQRNRLTGAEVVKIIHRHRNRTDRRNRIPRSAWLRP